MFSEQEKKQIEERGSDIAQVEQQVENFINGFPYLSAGRAASVGDGILKFNEEEVKRYQQLYIDKSKSKKIIKFVPASGAASRMFKELFAFLEDKDFENNKAVQQFINGLSNFAFYGELTANLKSKGFDIDAALKPEQLFLNFYRPKAWIMAACLKGC